MLPGANLILEPISKMPADQEVVALTAGQFTNLKSLGHCQCCSFLSYITFAQRYKLSQGWPDAYCPRWQAKFPG